MLEIYTISIYTVVIFVSVVVVACLNITHFMRRRGLLPFPSAWLRHGLGLKFSVLCSSGGLGSGFDLGLGLGSGLALFLSLG